MKPETTAFYQENCKQSRERIQRLNRKSTTLSTLRLLVLLGGGALIFQVVQTEHVFGTLISFLGTVFAFVLLVRYQSQLSQKKRNEEHFLFVNENELAISESITKNGYESGYAFGDDQHIYASDLDLFGPGSIYQLLNRTATREGNTLLASWLSNAAEKGEIASRQQFVEEVAEDFPWWLELQGKLYGVKNASLDAKKIISHHLVNEIAFPSSKLLERYTALVPYLFALLFVLAYFQPVFSSVIVVFAVLHLLSALGMAKYVNAVSSGFNRGGVFLQAYVPGLQQIEQREWQSAMAQGLQEKIVREAGVPVSASIERLSTLLNRLDARLNVAVGMFLNAFLLWDFRQVYSLKKWQSQQSKGILEALDMFSTVEVIGSIASLRFNHPDWVMPEIVSDFPTLEMKDAKHPLIAEVSSIPNTYHLEEHRIALITGSNMAGKSTFLRTVGVNAVLAFAGAPVCASQMRVSVMQLATYMRIRDSLNESTSTFKAELDRIQKILTLVGQNERTFILLDEMLRGTNSMDKYLGSKAIIEKLIREKGVGMVATHDLKLSELSEQYPKIVENFHFDIQVKDQEMLFDYKLKNGPCTTFNASILLKKIGIEI